MAVVGVDEAGKGPVLGSMFAAAVRRPDDVSLPQGLADSKTLSPERRDRLDAVVRAIDDIGVAVAEVPVPAIDDHDTDMNGLTVGAHAAALSAVAKADDIVRCDAADVDAGRFARRLRERMAEAGLGGLDIRAEHRADERHAVVSAASVVAKVARDTHVAELAGEYGDVGSGYPSDPATQAFLERYVGEHGRLPDCARASWETSKRALATVEQTGLGEF